KLRCERTRTEHERSGPATVGMRGSAVVPGNAAPFFVWHGEGARLDGLHDDLRPGRVVGSHPEVDGAHAVGAAALAFHQDRDVLRLQTSPHQFRRERVSARVDADELIHGPILARRPSSDAASGNVAFLWPGSSAPTGSVASQAAT